MSWIDAPSDEERSKLREQRQPDRTAPLLATLTRDPFSDRTWLVTA